MTVRTVIRTVVQAAASKDLTDLATVKDELSISGVASDAKLTRYIQEASAAAQQFCNRVFAVERIRDQFWPRRDAIPSPIPGGEMPLQLTTWPVVSVESVLENGTALVVDDDYRVDADLGQLVRLDANGYPRSWPTLAIQVEYHAGYGTLPPDISGKIVRMVTARYFAAGRDPSLRSENIPGVRDVSWWIATGTDAGNLPPDVLDVLNNYRVPVVR
ncbi:hypothetical protein [Rhizobium sp. SGZ-381]|uniref:hypothetical protein n=1 Tax=Rhizobium sp. SGZ-381 TaxID=3342800 RepID=UPI00366AE1B7